MNIEDFEALLDRFGSVEDDWPVQQREAMTSLLERDDNARSALQAARDLDLALASFQPAIPDLSQRIMEAIPPSLPERLLAWLFPGGGASVLRPVLASALPQICGAVLGLSLPLPDDEMSTWELQERSLVAPLESEIWYE
jgi:hypothetical protein